MFEFLCQNSKIFLNISSKKYLNQHFHPKIKLTKYCKKPILTNFLGKRNKKFKIFCHIGFKRIIRKFFLMLNFFGEKNIYFVCNTYIPGQSQLYLIGHSVFKEIRQLLKSLTTKSYWLPNWGLGNVPKNSTLGTSWDKTVQLLEAFPPRAWGASKAD